MCHKRLTAGKHSFTGRGGFIRRKRHVAARENAFVRLAIGGAMAALANTGAAKGKDGAENLAIQRIDNISVSQ